MIATIDGKILTGRWEHLPVTKSVGGLYDTTAAEYDVGAWFVGTTTMREFFTAAKKFDEPKRPVPKGDYIANAEAETFAIATDTHGSIRFDDNEVGGDHIVVIIAEKTSNGYRAHLRQQGISYLVCGTDEVDLSEAMTKLRSLFKIKKLLLEGGGLINGGMLQAGLIDEISQLIAPIVDGGGAEISGLYDLRTKPPKRAAAALRLIEQRTLKGGVQWLRYRVKPK
jgi:2,5-diamino-6-(ribosylamino)-4(3H)-pyrimidinone 5'-phosphate reductase